MSKKEHKKKININLNEDYSQFWTQDASNLAVDWDSNELQFWIEEKDKPYPPKLRSKGKLWHLAFYIKLTAYASKETDSVILIDNPGLNLHPKAQKDILKKLEDLAEDTKVIYTTHSPYLIQSENLKRVWLIEREEGGYTEISKLHADADKETLTPILTAMGANTSIGIQVDKENSIVVEGISDYNYLQAFKELVDWHKDLDIIPATGSDTPVHVGSILFGWGMDPLFCLDPDDPHEIRRKLKENLQIKDKKIIYVLEEGRGKAIEDIFSKDDFKKYVLDDPELSFKSQYNSQYMKRSGKQKFLLSKKFWERVENEDVELSDKTLERIRKIFSKLEEAIQNGN